MRSPIIFATEETRVRDSYLQRLASFQHQCMKKPGLKATLQHALEAIAEIPLIGGALIAATDGHGEPTYYENGGAQCFPSDIPFERFRSLRRWLQIPRGNEWVSIPSIASLGTERILGRLLRFPSSDEETKTCGLLIIQTDYATDTTSESFQVLEHLASHLAFQIGMASTHDEQQLTHKLQELAVKEFTPPVPNTRSIVTALRKALDADSVTLLLKEHKKLYLSASTDFEIVDSMIGGAEEDEFTAYVLKHERPIRLFDATDRNEMSQRTRGSVENSRYTDNEATPLPIPSFHLLAVPTYSSNPKRPNDGGDYSGPTDHVNGVLQVSRSSRPFSQFELDALSHTGVVLGTVISRSWQIFLSRKLWQAGTEGVAVSRYERPQTELKAPSTDSAEKTKGISRLVDLNQAARFIFGAKATGLRNLDVEELYEPEDWEDISSRLSKLSREGGEALGPCPVRIRRRSDNAIISTEISYRLVTSPFVVPEAQYTASLIRDTSERQKILDQHERLVKLLNARNLAYFRADKNGQTLETSDAESKLTGYSKEELDGKARLELYVDVDDHFRLYKEADDYDGKLLITVQVLKRKDGTSFPANGLIRLLKDADGNPLGYEGLYEDATDKVRLQEFLGIEGQRVLEDPELFERIQQNTRLNLDYMTSLSHQLRTPLGALAHNLFDFLRGLPPTSPLNRKLEYLTAQTKVCNLLAKNLSYIDRILQGEEYAEEVLEIDKIASGARHDFRHTLRAFNLQLVVRTHRIRRKFRKFQGSPDLFRQVMINLVDNAIKYSETGTEIRISAESNRKNRSLTISNVGLPIAEEQLEKIFERGFRSPIAISWCDGTGMGLWLVERIVQLHGGKISCTSEPRNDSPGLNQITFILTFPPLDSDEPRKEISA